VAEKAKQMFGTNPIQWIVFSKLTIANLNNQLIHQEIAEKQCV